MRRGTSRRHRTLVTGGAGFVGSHQVVALQSAGYEVAVVDDLSNSWQEALERIRLITGETPRFWNLDIRHAEGLRAVTEEFQPDSVIHLAGRKHVGESTVIPQQYYETNVGGLLSLLDALRPMPIRRLVFSSSGSVYGPADTMPIPECQPHRPTNPNSASKSICERILGDLCSADPSWSIIALRYFNPTGAHGSGILGECAVGPPSNLMPSLVEAAMFEQPITVHGDDYNTSDGTGVRDYVHVEDVAEAHLRALALIDGREPTGYEALNVGRGVGISVLELVQSMEQVSRRRIDVKLGPRRSGDIDALCGDTTILSQRLGMTEYKSVDEMCADAWRFRVNNPDGYQTNHDKLDVKQTRVAARS